MRLFYPYNEILPKRSAHDVFIFQECSSLMEAGAEVTLLCGQGSQDDHSLFAHYHVTTPFQIKRLACIRKNNPFGISWNFPFFYLSSRYIAKKRPDVVLFSVLKQAAFNLKKRVKGMRYLFEVHELAAYPGRPYDPLRLALEKEVFSKVDLITVTTNVLKEILQSPPYNVTTKIFVVPLAVAATPLLPAQEGPFTLFYVGQLYKGQGLELLLQALSLTFGVQLKVVGGKTEEIVHLSELAKKLQITDRVEFLGYQQPKNLKPLLQQAHAFVAPFEGTGRMPFVAHTKLSEYIEWGRAVIAPDLQVCHEHFPEKKGALFFEPGNKDSLAEAIVEMKQKYRDLQKEILRLQGKATWQKRAADYLSILTEIR